MPVRIIQEVISLFSPRVEPVPFSSDLPPCYPWPELAIAGHEPGAESGADPQAVREVDTLSLRLENDFVSVTVAPRLGGRILELRDQRSGQSIVGLPSKVALEQGGAQGITWPHGIRFVGHPQWANELGPTDFRVIEPADSDSKGAIFLFDWQGDLSIHTALTLAPDSAELLIEQIIFNRSWFSIEVSPGLVSTLPARRLGESVELGDHNGIAFIDAALHDSRIGPERQRLGGRRTLSWSTCAVIYSGLPGERSHSRKASLSVESTTIRSEVHAPDPAKLLLYANGQTFESVLPSEPTATVATDVSSLGEVTGMAIRMGSGGLVGSWPIPASEKGEMPAQSDLWRRLDDLIAGDAPPEFYLREPGAEPYGNWQLALRSIENQDIDAVNQSIDKLLSFNAEDPLAWWLRSASARELDAFDDESPALPNAHFLAPLEPLLKAEAFLNMPVQEGRSENPLLAGIASDPPCAAALVGQYLSCGLLRGMASLADELLRLRDNALIRYLLAAAHLALPKGDVPAAEQVSLAGQLPLEPPFPSRAIEIEAVLLLARRFPDDARLQVFAELASKVRESAPPR